MEVEQEATKSLPIKIAIVMKSVLKLGLCCNETNIVIIYIIKRLSYKYVLTYAGLAWTSA